MKKNGFTLTEILAVIVILGIISLITITTVTRIIKNVSGDVFKLNEKNLSLSAENYYKLNYTALPRNINSQVMVTIDTLVTNNFSKRIKNPDNKSEACDGYVVITKESETKYNYDPYLKCGNTFVTSGYVLGGPILQP
jgi:prepilin-type N-terminal cleavage/methylation domain-containing protein